MEQRDTFAETGLDKALPYIGVLMQKTDAANYPRYELPEGYGFRFYEPGMEEDFVCLLQHLAGGLDSIGAARDIFMREFSRELDALKTRMVFAVAPDGECAGTVCLWQGGHLGESHPRLHYLAVHPAHQNRGISKALLTKLFNTHNTLGLGDFIYLTTQTWSYKAINIYFEFGFNSYIGKKPVGFKSGDFENENSLAWNLIVDKLELYENEKRKRIGNG